MAARDEGADGGDPGDHSDGGRCIGRQGSRPRSVLPLKRVGTVTFLLWTRFHDPDRSWRVVAPSAIRDP